MAEKAESRAVELDIHDKKRVFDIDDPVLPGWIDDKAFGSGDYPYDKKLDNKEYERLLKLLQIELVKVQFWQQKTGRRIMAVFEGRDAAGKGGAIHATTSYMNPRSARVVALTKPTGTEQGQWYYQRYVATFPTTGEFVLFDRSWYNRAGVEPVMGFCTPEQHARYRLGTPRTRVEGLDDAGHAVAPRHQHRAAGFEHDDGAGIGRSDGIDQGVLPVGQRQALHVLPFGSPLFGEEDDRVRVAGRARGRGDVLAVEIEDADVPARLPEARFKIGLALAQDIDPMPLPSHTVCQVAVEMDRKAPGPEQRDLPVVRQGRIVGWRRCHLEERHRDAHVPGFIVGGHAYAFPVTTGVSGRLPHSVQEPS